MTKLVIAILFANNVEALMGTTEDPSDGGAVARTCIGAVIVYSVSPFLIYYPNTFTNGLKLGISGILWMSSSVA